ncbi:hypothetical protein TRFO_40636 [Tritrichomonas foetus]|uniref:Uncharacterized protein n=1 Tax=Tritrichomonas foetus TaxID=1144522 RepID=A0A1J4J760_9EUKA|nr:hypothetical protein TRFO_40636 [Tritrichomonas foetus]|eukprot:OHS93036.1 hypothetical protein TRFO_40636 [Tritrichomonas foetus]
MSEEKRNGPLARAHRAIENDNVEELSQIAELQSWCSLSVEATLNFFGKEYKNPTLVQYAAFNCKSKCLKYILRRCPNVLDNLTDSPLSNAQIALPYPYPLLHIAVLGGDIECVAAVIRYSTLGEKDESFINKQDNLGFTALHFLSINNDYSETEGSISSVQREKLEKQYQADLEKRKRIARLLLDNGASLWIPNCMSETPLITALMRNQDLFQFYVEYLLEKHEKLNLKDFLEERKFEYGTADGHPRTIEECLKSNPDASAALEWLKERIFDNVQTRSVEVADLDSSDDPVSAIRNGTPFSSIIPTKRCGKQSCVILEDLERCPYCGTLYCQTHFSDHVAHCNK